MEILLKLILIISWGFWLFIGLSVAIQDHKTGLVRFDDIFLFWAVAGLINIIQTHTFVDLLFSFFLIIIIGLIINFLEYIFKQDLFGNADLIFTLALGLAFGYLFMFIVLWLMSLLSLIKMIIKRTRYVRALPYFYIPTCVLSYIYMVRIIF